MKTGLVAVLALMLAYSAFLAEIFRAGLQAVDKGQIEADEAAMIAKVFQLNDLTARDLMVPRVSAPTLDGAASLGSRAWPLHKASHSESFNGFHRAYLPEVLRPDVLKDKE